MGKNKLKKLETEVYQKLNESGELKGVIIAGSNVFPYEEDNIEDDVVINYGGEKQPPKCGPEEVYECSTISGRICDTSEQRDYCYYDSLLNKK